MDGLVQHLANYGLPGVVVAIVLVLYVRKDQELSAEKNYRIADAKAYTDMALKLQEKVTDAIDKLKAIFEATKAERGR